MTRQFISGFGDRHEVHEIFIASEKQLRSNRNGNLYLQLRLSDRTGTINAMMWNADDSVYSAFENGDYVQVHGTSQIYNGNMQVILNQIERAEPGRIDESEFVQIGASGNRSPIAATV